MNPLAVLGPYKYLVYAGVAAAAFGWHVYDRSSAVDDALAVERAAQVALTLAAEQDRRQTEQGLQAAADNTRKEKDAQIQKLDRSLAAAIDRLRKRADRPAVMPAVAGAGGSCTGASLYRPDAEFLARESSRADRLLAGLQRCQAQYQAARQALMPKK